MRFSWTTWASVRSLMTTESTPRRARRRGGPGRLSGYSTPLVWKIPQRSEVVFLGGQKVQSFDLVTGKQRWEVGGLAGQPKRPRWRRPTCCMSGAAVRGRRADILDGMFLLPGCPATGAYSCGPWTPFSACGTRVPQ